MQPLIWALVTIGPAAVTATWNSTVSGYDTSIASSTSIPTSITQQLPRETGIYSSSSAAQTASIGSDIECYSVGCSNSTWAMTSHLSNPFTSMAAHSEAAETTAVTGLESVYPNTSYPPLHGTNEWIMATSSVPTITKTLAYGGYHNSTFLTSFEYPLTSPLTESQYSSDITSRSTEGISRSTAIGTRTPTSASNKATLLPEVPSWGERGVSGKGKKLIACCVALTVVVLLEVGAMVGSMS